jgi:hypothetical protein
MNKGCVSLALNCIIYICPVTQLGKYMVNDLKIAPLFLNKLIILFLISSYFLQHLSGKYWDENPC